MHPTPYIVRLFSFASPFPSPRLFTLNDNALPKHGGRLVSYFSFWFLVCIVFKVYSFRYPFICTSVFHLVTFRYTDRIACRDVVDWIEMPTMMLCLIH